MERGGLAFTVHLVGWYYDLNSEGEKDEDLRNEETHLGSQANPEFALALTKSHLLHSLPKELYKNEFYMECDFPLPFSNLKCIF